MGQVGCRYSDTAEVRPAMATGGVVTASGFAECPSSCIRDTGSAD